ncbi:hypothetical protein Leryth_006618 [Lithospermum erythrorhizon]|nr:hypothetical protein Leryth_006618 [Lithospermum erythrorhizon]
MSISKALTTSSSISVAFLHRRPSIFRCSGDYSAVSQCSAASSLHSSVLLRSTKIACVSVDGNQPLTSASLEVPVPVVIIDQDSDAEATVVQVSFGDRLGSLIDTVMPSGRKVEDPDLLEMIRLTIINNLLKYHPESSERLAMGEVFGVKAPEKKVCVAIPTHIHVKDDGPKRSLLCIETADRSGLLLEIIKIMADINIDVESAEIHTEGLVAKDKFHVSYGGQALKSSLSKVLVNCLRDYLRSLEPDEDSY